MERILGIDPGFGRMGYGVIEKNSKNEWQALAYGCVTTSAQDSFVDRLKDLHAQLVKIIKDYQPTRVVVEKLFFMTNVKTAMSVGEARGVIILTAVEAGLPIDEFTPQEIKQAITGYGNADKSQMQKIVGIILGIKKKITPDDTADALAAAITGGNTLWQKRLSS